MKTSLIIAALAACLTTSAFARIGETEEQIEQRYGHWIPPRAGGTMPMKMYRAAGILVGVTYIDGRSESEFFQKPDHGEFSENEILLLLGANSDAKTWKKIEGGPVGHDYWMRDGALCTYDKIRPNLMIMSHIFQVKSAELRREAEAKKLSGF